ncbi:phospholipase A1-like isoform X2 [Planococcus citri]
MRSFDVDMSSPVWLHSSDWNPSHETIILVHGYGGTADHLPTGILRDAYIKNGSYNVIVVDWGPLSRLPCYLSAVHNIKSAAKCIGELFKFLRNSGVDMRKTSCVGHSLGAHVCGVVSNYLNFRLHKIIGLDPAKPLIPNVLKSRLDAGDADQVQVLHTSSSYGDSKKIGHIDFYFNGGRIQPYCVNVTNEELCSHMRSVCYLAESIFADRVRHGTKCKRRNLQGESDSKGILNRIGNAHFMPVGQFTPEGAVGTYCVSNIDAPFCSAERSDKGSPFCCRPSPTQSPDVSTVPALPDNAIGRESKSNKVNPKKKNKL